MELRVIRWRMAYALVWRKAVTDAGLYERMLEVAIDEARIGLSEGGIPIGAALFTKEGKLVSPGTIGACSITIRACMARRMRFGPRGAAAQLSRPGDGDNACALLVLQRAGAAVQDWHAGGRREPDICGGLDWLREHGVAVIDLDNRECQELLQGFIAAHPATWNEDIGAGLGRMTENAQAMAFFRRSAYHATPAAM